MVQLTFLTSTWKKEWSVYEYRFSQWRNGNLCNRVEDISWSRRWFFFRVAVGKIIRNIIIGFIEGVVGADNIHFLVLRLFRTVTFEKSALAKQIECFMIQNLDQFSGGIKKTKTQTNKLPCVMRKKWGLTMQWHLLHWQLESTYFIWNKDDSSANVTNQPVKMNLIRLN